jgi:hypothetical protein
MTRIFQIENYFEVTEKETCIEFEKFDDKIYVTGKEEAGWESQRTNFVLTREEATALKLFLDQQGF